jgi:tetratricopeptide (TPR) repeat protein
MTRRPGHRLSLANGVTVPSARASRALSIHAALAWGARSTPVALAWCVLFPLCTLFTPCASRADGHADSLYIAKLYFAQGGDEYSRADLDSALVHFEHALAWDPVNPVIWQAKAATLARQFRYPEAIEAFDTTLRIKPDFAFAWWHRGCLNATTGHVEEAIADLRHAIAIDSTVKAWPAQDECWDRLRGDERLLEVTR